MLSEMFAKVHMIDKKMRSFDLDSSVCSEMDSFKIDLLNLPYILFLGLGRRSSYDIETPYSSMYV